ncbi:MAG: ribbon-helix-helix domain-containing protein [Lachnospiraceae bacterium]
MATDKPRYTVSVDPELFQKIEDFRFEHRFQTRSEATVELIRLGLDALENGKNKSSENASGR